MNINTGSFFHFLYTIKLSHHRLDMLQKNRTHTTKIRRPISTSLRPDRCAEDGERMCEDGSCIARVELCPEEQLMNQNTILIMIVVGLAVVVFLVILYCFQQRQRRANQRLEGATSGYSDECDHESLYAPPPAYEEVINSNNFPPTPQQNRLRPLSTEEPTSPMTPPPNYASALIILAQSQESLSLKYSNPTRRSVSLDQVFDNSTDTRGTPVTSNKNRRSLRRGNIFRFSRQHFKTNSKNLSENSSSVNPPPPYPDSPLLIPDYPPPPPTPLPSERAPSSPSSLPEDFKHQDLVPTITVQSPSHDSEIIT